MIIEIGRQAAPLWQTGLAPKTHPIQYLLIAGAPKSATTSLYRYLSDHPQICASSPKETYFFAREFDFKDTCQVGYALEDFESFFEHCDGNHRVLIEATPFTLYSAGAAKDIESLLQEGSIIFILRDPIDRLNSNFRYHIQRSRVAAETTFAEYIEAQLGNQGNVPGPLTRGCYMDYLPSFIELAERIQISIVLYEEFVANPAAIVKTLCQSLGLNANFYDDFSFPVHNQTVAVRSRRLGNAVMSLEPSVKRARSAAARLPVAGPVMEALLRRGSRAYRSINGRTVDDDTAISPETTAILAEYYRPSIEALATVLGRKLPWPSAPADLQSFSI